MHTPGTEPQANGLGAAAKRLSEHASALARLELELAQVELKEKAGVLGKGISFFVGAAVFGLFALGFLFATVAAAIALALPTWAALLIVGGVLVLIAGIFGLIGRRDMRKGVPPVPKQAIDEAKATSAALRSGK
jgi:uncharacterized membrane protein YqjE